MNVRRRAAEALGHKGGSADSAISALTDLLTDKDNDVRWYAATALGNISKNAAVSLSALKKLLHDQAQLQPLE